ncbi:MAG: FtsX-like permease family protein [bacterium]
MFSILKLAGKNIFRNKRRTTITLLAIFVGIGSVVISKGIVAGFQKGIIDLVTRVKTGHIQIHTKGYLDALQLMPLRLYIKELKKTEKIIRKQKEVVHYARRINFTGMLSTGEESTMFMGIGIEPKSEFKICRDLLSGIIKGKELKGFSPYSALITNQLAKGLQVDVGDTIMLISHTINDTMNAVDVQVEGIVQIGTPVFFSGNMLITTLAAAQKLLDMKGKVTEIIIGIDKIENLENVAETLRGKFNTKRMNLEVHTWKDIVPYYKDTIQAQNVILWIIVLILLIIIGTSIMNTMMIAVFERTREIGVMMAIGTERMQIFLLFLFESLFTGVIGSFIGCVSGALFVCYLNIIGITINLSGELRSVTFYPYVTENNITFSFLFGIFVSIISGIYPAYLALQLKPVDALRYV